MTETHEELLNQVLQCANRAAGTSLILPHDDDIPLEAFRFDSLSLFSFLLELERTCGMKFDETLLNQEQLHSIRSAVVLIKSRTTSAP
jgi:acyl carrier protein